MKGKLPATEFIKLESNEDQWNMLIRGLFNELKTTAIIQKEKDQNVRIRLVITKIYRPEEFIRSNKVIVETNMEKDIANGIFRNREFINDFLSEKSWLLFGFIDGEEKVPILINYYETINIAVYSQKLKEDEAKAFFPIDPNLN